MAAFIDYDELLMSELAAAATSPRSYPRFAQHFPAHLDLLLRLPHFRGTDPAVNTPDHDFHFFCFQRYVELPYMFRAVYILWERAFYVPAIIVTRSLVESLVQLRYFHQNKEKLKDHLIPKRARDRVRFQTMFEAVAPGYYAKQYGRLLSGFAHSGLSAGIWRFELDFQTAGASWYQGCVFSDSGSVYLINQVWPLIFGFANYFPHFFPGYQDSADAQTEGRRQTVLAELDQWMREHEAQNEKSREWHRLVDLLVR